MADFSLRLDAAAAVRLATEALERHQLRVVHSFDLREALQAQNSACTCPHHGTPDCKCNYVVLLAYDDALGNPARPAGRVVIHSHSGTTWLSIPPREASTQLDGGERGDRLLLRAVAEVMCEAAL